MFNKKEVKNIKKDYVANTVIIYFSDTELGDFEKIHKSIRANTKFFKIGSSDPNNTNSKEKNKFESSFLSWASPNVEEKAIPAPIFFQKNIVEIKKILENADLAIILYKSQDADMLSYVRELAYILNKYDVFSFHCVVENFITGKNEDKLYSKLKKDAVKYSQPFIPISEVTVIDAYEDANLVNRKSFISKFALDLIESIIVPYVEPDLNPDHFSLIKSLFYSNSKNFKNRVIPSIGISNSKVDWLDLSIVQALSNPIFCGSFGASDTFIITIKAPYLTTKMIERIKYILTTIIGKDKKFIICKYVGEFEIDVYSQITILALSVDESKLLLEPEDIEKNIKNILLEVQKSKQFFRDQETKTIVLDMPWEKLKNK